jgi:hypothetical protein
VSLFASGSEVEIAMNARKLLRDAGINARVVSVPCFELFEAQDADYQASTLGEAPVNIAIEAAIRMGWDRFIGTDGIFIGMDSLRRIRPLQGSLRAFRHHRRSRRRGRQSRAGRRANALLVSVLRSWRALQPWHFIVTPRRHSVRAKIQPMPHAGLRKRF